MIVVCVLVPFRDWSDDGHGVEDEVVELRDELELRDD